jgi:hypothetical protein
MSILSALRFIFSRHLQASIQMVPRNMKRTLTSTAVSRSFSSSTLHKLLTEQRRLTKLKKIPSIVHDQMIRKYRNSKLTTHFGLCLYNRHGPYVNEHLPRYDILSIGEWYRRFGKAFCCLRLQNLTIPKNSRE